MRPPFIVKHTKRNIVLAALLALLCIGAAELLYTAQVLGAKYYNYLDPLIIAGCMYLVMTVTISFIARKIEKRMAVSD